MSPSKFCKDRGPLFLALILALGVTTVFGAGLGFDTAIIETTTGIKGTRNETEGVFKISVPRKDVAVMVEGWKMAPFMGLTSWAGFSSGEKSEVMLMGDIVLFEDEVNAAMSAALDHGLNVTALHNHFFFAEPQVYFMHIGGDGKCAELASGVKSIFEAVAKTREVHPGLAKQFIARALPAESSINAPALETVFQSKGLANSGMVKFVFGRNVTMACGCQAGKEMGVNTWAAFAGADDNAVVDGDFVATASELQTVLKSLRNDGINIVAIHSHMTEETPRLLFLHYWGRGKAADLATAVKKAMDSQRK